MKTFLDENFLLDTPAAERLYHEYAKGQPIVDYHCHLPPEEVATNKRFENLYEIWLAGDHYKWRAMRANGVEESLITGNAEPYEKFLAWARTVPNTLRNPLYHWTHLELRRYFGIDTLLSEETAKEIWEAANAKLKEDALSAQGILDRFKVEVVGTTDDPADDLAHHRAFASTDHKTVMAPTFRPDKAMAVDQPEPWNAYLDQLAKTAGRTIESFEDLLAVLRARHDFFHEVGARLSDHGLSYCPFRLPTDSGELEAIFHATRGGRTATAEQWEIFATAILLEVGRWNHERGWTMQLHLGALRGNNERLLKTLGADVGCDSIGDWRQAPGLSGLLNALDVDDQLPKTILYNLNPSDNYLFATMVGNFQGGGVAGKLQFGSGWWFLDQLEGMRWQMNALSSQGLLSRFVGMLTDSRSFLSYPRHEYFRRLLCQLLGEDMEKGLIPPDFEQVGAMVQNIAYRNARAYFGFA